MRRATSPFVLDAVEEFLRTKAAREEKTKRSYAGVLLGSDRGTKPALGLALAPYFQNRRFNTVEPDEIATWFGRRVRGGAQATKHRVSKEARAFLRFASERGYADPSLAAVIEPYRVGEPRRDWLGWDQIDALVAAIGGPRYRLAVSWLFGTGCRVGEACSAQQRDVLFRKESDMWAWTIPDSKTDAARVVWLPDYLVDLLEQSRARNNPRPDWPVLWDCEGRGFGRVENPAASISPRTINSVLDRAATKIGLPIHVTNHIAKHSYCNNWIANQGGGEIEMEKLSRQVGTSVETLRKTYLHLDQREEDWAYLKTLGRR